MRRDKFISQELFVLIGKYGTFHLGTWWKRKDAKSKNERDKKFRLILHKKNEKEHFALEPWHSTQKRMLRKLVYINIKSDAGTKWFSENYESTDEPDEIHKYADIS